MSESKDIGVPFVLLFSETIRVEERPGTDYDEESQVGNLDGVEASSTTSHRRGCSVEDD